ncbi:MAG: hypothetical protein J6P47_07000, partial [Acetobacter sp.]|nr:hypothetical protein [Acetobacter sp.]
MKSRSFNKFLSSMVIALTLFIGFSPKSHAQGIPVTNAEQLAETILQYIRQGFQWILQKEQFILQNRNTFALAAEIWTLANSIVNQVHNLDNAIQYLSRVICEWMQKGRVYSQYSL